MTKAESAKPATPKSERKWEVEHAMHILREAGEIVADKKLMAEVEKLAAERAGEMKAVAHKAGQLAKRGMVSEKAMAKLAEKHK